MLFKLMHPTSGQVLLLENDMPIADEREIKSRIGYLSNNTKLYGRLSVRELLTIIGNV